MKEYLQYLEEILGDYAIPAVETLFVVLAGILIYALYVRAVHRLARKGLITLQLESLLTKTARGLLVIVLILLVLGFFGVSVSTLWATLSGILVLVALGFVAVWSVLSNVLCSILLVIFSPFRIGDEIEIQDPAANISLRGKVTGINMMFTTLVASGRYADETEEEEVIMRVPNNLFFQKYIRLWHGAETSSLQGYLAKKHEEAEDSK